MSSKKKGADVIESISRRRVLSDLIAAGAVVSVAGVARFAEAQSPQESDLEITAVETFIMPDAIFVKLTADSGAVGWGECATDNVHLMETFVHHGLAGHVLGRDPFNTRPVWDDMFYRNHDSGPGGALANAISGVDIALWDLKGRVLDRSIHELLGGRYRNRMPVYGSYGTGRWKRLSPREAADQAEKFVDRGFRTVKCRMQIRESHMNPADDRTVEYVRTIKQRIGDRAELFVDINNGYSAGRAIQVGRILQDDYGLRFFEEPCSDQNHKETAEVVDALDIAVIAGEKEYTLWQLAELIRYANPDFLNPDVVKAGGISEMHRIAHFATAFQKQLILHNTRPTISTAASLQLIAAVPNAGPFMEYVDVDRFDDLLSVMAVGLDYEDGHLRVPEGPGLGIEIDEARVRERSTSVRESRL